MGPPAVTLTPEEVEDIYSDFAGLFAGCLEIRVKDGLPKAFGYDDWFVEQKAFEAGRTGRDIVLKPRQVGFTTLELARDLMFALTNPGSQVLVIVHTDKAADVLFQTLHVFCDSLDQEGLLPKRKYSSKQEIVFDAPLNSAVRIVQAGASERAADNVGRSGTVHRLHATEVAFWSHAQRTMAAAMSCVPTTGEVVVESTANGAGGWFYDRVMAALAGLGRYKLHFYPWFQHEEYRMSIPVGFDPAPADEWERILREQHGCDDKQIAFWRHEVEVKGVELALQEYPESVVACFRAAGNPWLSATVVDRVARSTREPLRMAPMRFKGLRFADAKMFELPLRGEQYVIGGDVSEGIAKDGSSATVLHRKTARVVATWWDDATPAKDFGLVLAILGYLYNRALVAPERNNDGKATLVGLMDTAKYSNVYHDVADGRPGWNTTPSSRQIMLGDLAFDLRQGSVAVSDVDTIGELRTIIRDKDGKPRARGKREKSADACRDDRVVSLAIALQVREHFTEWQPGQDFRFEGA